MTVVPPDFCLLLWLFEKKNKYIHTKTHKNRRVLSLTKRDRSLNKRIQRGHPLQEESLQFCYKCILDINMYSLLLQRAHIHSSLRAKARRESETERQQVVNFGICRNPKILLLHALVDSSNHVSCSSAPRTGNKVKGYRT